MKLLSLIALTILFSSCTSTEQNKPEKVKQIPQEEKKFQENVSPWTWTWTLILSDSLLAKELEVQQAMVVSEDKNDPRLRQWAKESAACAVVNRLAEMPMATRIKPLLAIEQVLVTGPKELEVNLKLLIEEGLIDGVYLIDGPNIPAPILVD